MKGITLISLIIFSFLALIIGCNKEETPVTPPSEHFEPEGWMIKDPTLKPILVVWQGVIQKNWNGQAVNDTLFAPFNNLSDHLTVKFLDINKNQIDPPKDADHTLGWLIDDVSYLQIVQDKPTDWAFHLKGLKLGKTNLELRVNHLGHSDVKTPKIPVVIR